MGRAIRNARDDAGAAAVEFALVLPILVMLLFGIMQFGIVYDAQITVDHAAREGARMAAVGGNVAGAVAAQTTGLDASKVSLTGPTLKNDATRGDYYEVTVKYAYTLDIPLWGTKSLSLQSTAQMRKEN